MVDKERPILFSTEMVRAILNGRKTQTRRVAKPQPASGVRKSIFVASWLEDGHGREIKVPYHPGDILWVRETWQSFFPEEVTPNHFQGPRSFSGIPAESVKGHYMYFYYRADGEIPNACWMPSIHMPREAARLFLTVKDVRLERVQEITSKDISSELGAEFPQMDSDQIRRDEKRKQERLFISLWNNLYAKRGHGWDINPWVWVIEFERR